MASEELQGRGYRIECEECGATEWGGPDTDLEWDKRYHRMHHCPDAEFEVTPQ